MLEGQPRALKTRKIV